MVTLYKSPDYVCNADRGQIDGLLASGWSHEEPKGFGEKVKAVKKRRKSVSEASRDLKEDPNHDAVIDRGD